MVIKFDVYALPWLQALSGVLCGLPRLPPRLYGLPKVRKDDIPLRPIVNSIGSPTYALSRHLADLLRPHIGQMNLYIKDSTHFIDKINDTTLQETDLLVSFDVVSLLTNVPLHDTMTHIRNIFPEDITALFHHTLMSTYFQWNQNFYEQKEGVAMGSPLSPAIDNLNMEKFEDKALQTAKKKPTHWLRYVDDTFVIWSHGKEELQRFIDHLNSIYPMIQFTMEV